MREVGERLDQIVHDPVVASQFLQRDEALYGDFSELRLHYRQDRDSRSTCVILTRSMGNLSAFTCALSGVMQKRVKLFLNRMKIYLRHKTRVRRQRAWIVGKLVMTT